MVIELGVGKSQSSTRTSKFYALLIMNLNLMKQGSKIGHPKDSIWDRLVWEPAVITTTLSSTAYVLYTHPYTYPETFE